MYCYAMHIRSSHATIITDIYFQHPANLFMFLHALQGETPLKESGNHPQQKRGHFLSMRKTKNIQSIAWYLNSVHNMVKF